MSKKYHKYLSLNFFRSDYKSSDVGFGAWWLGFLVAAALGTLVSMPTSMFPRDTEAGKVNRLNRSKEMHSDQLALELENKTDDEKSLVAVVKIVFVIKVYDKGITHKLQKLVCACSFFI